MEKNFWANKPRHKAIALVLLVCMLMTLMPAMVWAETAPVEVNTAEGFLSAITSGSSVKLIDNVTVTTSAAVTIATGSSLTLDLNSHTLKMSSSTELNVNKSDLTLTITDSSDDANGKYDGTVAVQSGTLVIQGGTFTFDPEIYVNSDNYTVIDNNDGTWTVKTKPSEPVAVNRIEISGDSTDVPVGGEITLTAALAPNNATTGTSLTWTSSDPDKAIVAAVTNTGLSQIAKVTLTGAAKDDIITISATNEKGIEGKYVLNVIEGTAPTLKLSLDSMNLQVGANDNLTATLTPANTSDELEWSVTEGAAFIELSKTSTTNNAHTINVKALAAGTATISVSVKNDTTIAPVTCTVTVTGEGQIPVTGIRLDKSTLVLAADASDVVSAILNPANANQGTTLTWESSDEDVAKVTVNADTHSATITGEGPGTAIITVSNGTALADTCTVTVAERPVTAIQLSSAELNLLTGNSGNLTATLLPANATTGTTLTWESSAPAVVTLAPAADTHSAAYTAAGTGDAVITVSNGSVSASCTVNVSDTAISVNEITLNPTELALDLNGNITGSIKATVLPAGANKNTNLTWTSSDSAVVTVIPASTTGSSEVTVAAAGEGTATITVSNDAGVTAACAVTVTNSKVIVTDVKLYRLVTDENGNSVKEYAGTEATPLAVGAVLGLNAECTGANTSQVPVRWNVVSATAEAVAVDSNGVVTARNAGDAVIVATVDGQYTESGASLEARWPVTVKAVIIPSELASDPVAQDLAGNTAAAATVDETKTAIANAAGITDPDSKVYLDTQLTAVTGPADSPVITFAVQPMVVQNITGADGEVTTETSTIANNALRSSITFRLPIPATVATGFAKVAHTISDSGRVEYLYLAVKADSSGHKFIDVTVRKFSNFEVSFVENLPTEAPEAAPSKASGSYTGTQNITLRIPDGAAVYYTTDGNAPTVVDGTPYQAGHTISITATTTLKVLVVHPDYLDGTYEYTYTITSSGGGGGNTGGGGGSTGGGGGTVVTPTNNDSWDNPYFDVSSTAWYYKAVKYATEKGLFSGVTDTQFGPNVSMTRGMLVTVLHKLEGRPAAGGNSFMDVSGNAYYSNAVAWAASKNIVSGIGDDMFAPGQAISREQMVVILYKYAQSKGMDTSANAALNNFVDVDKVSPWAREAMQWAVGAGLISGKNGSILDPTGTATRAEVASILMKFLED